MPNPLAAHPPWRQLLIVSIVLPVIAVAAVLAFAWPAGRVQPRDVPIGVVGASPAAEQVARGLDGAEPGAFELKLYPDAATARAAIRDRQVYGAFAVTPGHVDVLEASAAGSAVAQVLTGAGGALAGRAGLAEHVIDVVPLSAADPRGQVFASALLPLTICSILLAAAIGILVRFRPAWRQLVALVVVSAVTGAGSYLVAQPFLGALPHGTIADWGALSLTVLALSAATAGFVALLGAAGLGVAAALFVFVGNAFSAVTSAPELLPGAVDHLGQWLPPGAGANLLRSTAYFGGDAAAGHLGVLVAWVVFGAVAVVVGHHAPIRFAANRTTATATASRHTVAVPDERVAETATV